MKIRPVEVELFHTDGQTDMTKLIVAVAILWKSLKIDKGIYNKFNSPDIVTVIKVADWNSLSILQAWMAQGQ